MLNAQTLMSEYPACSLVLQKKNKIILNNYRKKKKLDVFFLYNGLLNTEAEGGKKKSKSRQDANVWNYNYWSLVLEKAFPLCLNALLRRFCSPQQVDGSAQNRGCRIVIRATGSCLCEISISSVTDCCAVMSSTMTSTTNNHFIQTLLLFHAHRG